MLGAWTALIHFDGLDVPRVLETARVLEVEMSLQVARSEEILHRLRLSVEEARSLDLPGMNLEAPRSLGHDRSSRRTGHSRQSPQDWTWLIRLVWDGDESRSTSSVCFYLEKYSWEGAEVENELKKKRVREMHIYVDEVRKRVEVLRNVAL